MFVDAKFRLVETDPEISDFGSHTTKHLTHGIGNFSDTELYLVSLVNSLIIIFFCDSRRLQTGCEAGYMRKVRFVSSVLHWPVCHKFQQINDGWYGVEVGSLVVYDLAVFFLHLKKKK